MNPALWGFGMRAWATLLLHARLRSTITDLEEKLPKAVCVWEGNMQLQLIIEKNLYLGMKESQKKNRRKDEMVTLKKWADA